MTVVFQTSSHHKCNMGGKWMYLSSSWLMAEQASMRDFYDLASDVSLQGLINSILIDGA